MARTAGAQSPTQPAAAPRAAQDHLAGNRRNQREKRQNHGDDKAHAGHGALDRAALRLDGDVFRVHLQLACVLGACAVEGPLDDDVVAFVRVVSEVCDLRCLLGVHQDANGMSGRFHTNPHMPVVCGQSRACGDAGEAHRLAVEAVARAQQTLHVLVAVVRGGKRTVGRVVAGGGGISGRRGGCGRRG